MAKLAARGGVFGRPSRPRSRSLASRGYGEDTMKVTDFNTLTFDCYGTLIDWERGILAELRPWADRAGRKDLGDNVLLEVFGTVEAACEAEFPSKLYPQILEEVLRRLATQWSITTSADDAVAFGQSVGRWPTFADSAT